MIVFVDCDYVLETDYCVVRDVITVMIVYIIVSG